MKRNHEIMVIEKSENFSLGFSLLLREILNASLKYIFIQKTIQRSKL